MEKQELIKKEVIRFEGESDNMEVVFTPKERRKGWIRPFMIMLNCKCVGDFKTFRGLENKVNQLISERNLTRTN